MLLRKREPPPERTCKTPLEAAFYARLGKIVRKCYNYEDCLVMKRQISENLYLYPEEFPVWVRNHERPIKELFDG